MDDCGGRNPIEVLIADGRINTWPAVHYGEPQVLTVDLEAIAANIRTNLRYVYQNHVRLSNQYGGCFGAIDEDIDALVDFALAITYNRLRKVLEAYHPSAVATRMRTRCPVPANLEFPIWLSETLGSIEPCRVMFGLADSLILYATSAATMSNFGRNQATELFSGRYLRITDAMRACKIGLAPINTRNMEGSYFPTINPEVIDSGIWNFYGTVPPNLYRTEDFVKMSFVCSENGDQPFEDMSFTIGFVDDEATLNALAAVPPPEGATADDPGRLVGGVFRVNFFGIQPAQNGAPRGCYVIGRGKERYFSSSIARNIFFHELLQSWRYNLTRNN